LCVDADEFIYHPQILSELESYKHLGYRILKCDAFQMLSQVFPTTAGQIYEEVNSGIADGRYTKAVVFDPSIDLSFSVGRHSVECDGTEIKESSLKLLHCRYLSADHMHNKHRRNYERLSSTNRERGYGGHNAPDYHGEYDLTWYQQSLKEAKPCLG
jgi:hypothetical protein